MMLRSKDGLSADEIVCKVMEPDQFKEIPGIPDEMPQRIKLLNGKYSIAIYGIEYSYDTWQGALQEERDSAVEALWNEITRREWELW
jgi:hypothetical protein